MELPVFSVCPAFVVVWIAGTSQENQPGVDFVKMQPADCSASVAGRRQTLLVQISDPPGRTAVVVFAGSPRTEVHSPSSVLL